MNRIRITVLAALCLCTAGVQSAWAQDIFRALSSPVPVATWTGFYVGANGGYGWAKDGSTATAVPGTTATSSFTMKGGFVGGQLGLNVQISGPWVVGLESDIQGSWMKFDGPGNLSNMNAAVGFAPPTTERVSIDWFGTTRGRLGYAADGILIYGTGGLAYASVRTTGGINGFTQVNDSPVKVGWAAGGGVEAMLARNWTLRGEYLHLDFGGTDDNFTALAGTVSVTLHQRITADIVRVGLNYMFR